ncbi:MAG: hypothetical protein ACE5KM_18930 [Planctomycetaceae bacterium]
MAKKKTASRKKAKTKAAASRTAKAKTSRRAKTASRKKPSKKTARKTAKKTAKKKAAKKATKRSAARKTAKKTTARKTGKRLGRARVSADAKLDVVFQKDYQAREVFDFLRVTTLRELEEHAPDEIVERMTRPLVQTVDRIRKALALVNRCLDRDERFALEFLAKLRARR